MNINQKINQKVVNYKVFSKFDLYQYEFICGFFDYQTAKDYFVNANMHGYIADNKSNILFSI